MLYLLGRHSVFQRIRKAFAGFGAVGSVDYRANLGRGNQHNFRPDNDLRTFRISKARRIGRGTGDGNRSNRFVFNRADFPPKIQQSRQKRTALHQAERHDYKADLPYRSACDYRSGADVGDDLRAEPDPWRS